MCGIGGVIRFDGQSVTHERMRAMLPTLRGRGPDDARTFTDRHVGLAHARLAVLDPRGGRQPMSDSIGDLTVVFNGEIYNHRDLRQQLERAGHRFATAHSDTEILLHGYRQWGEGLCARLDGMFAFALYDKVRGTVFLARDRTGKKPLWIRRFDNRWVFGSHVSTVLVGAGRRPMLNPEALRQYLTFGYTDEHALLRGITELPAGHWAVVGPRGMARGRAYWTPPTHRNPAAIRAAADPRSAEDAIRRALMDAVGQRLEADVPLGCFLSGGIDSSLIAAIAQRQLTARLGRLRTFSVSMPDARYDEGPIARRVAEHLGTEHHELTADGDVERDLLHLVRTTGEPLGDSSILPTYWLSRAARRHVTVALSGDGGDELFGGYDRYRALRMLRRHAAWLRCVPAWGMDGEQKSTAARMGRLVRAARQKSTAEQYLDIVRIFDRRQITKLGIGYVNETGDALDLPLEPDAAEAARRWDFAHYLPFDLLRKVDRASMAVGLEVRCPMLDTSVVELALSTPMSELMPGRALGGGRGVSGGEAKGLLRKIAGEWLPRDVVKRKKMGFAVPIGPWFAGPLADTLGRWLLDDTALTDIGFDRAALERLIRAHAAGADHTHRLFTLLSLAMWLKWVNSLDAVKA